MELICVFLGNAAFDTYRQTVVQADQPDYTLLSNHTGSSREVAALQEALGRAEGLSRVDFWQREDHIFLWYEGMDRSPVLSALKQAGGSSGEIPAFSQTQRRPLWHIWHSPPNTASRFGSSPRINTSPGAP